MDAREVVVHEVERDRRDVVLDLRPEGVLDRVDVDPVPGRGRLDTVGEPAGKVLDERVGAAGIAPADDPGWDQLDIVAIDSSTQHMYS